MPRHPEHINGSKTMALNARNFDKMARDQGYYYYCSAPGCGYRFLSISESEHHCKPKTAKGHGDDYYPILDKVF